jgi:hypothetical protein
MIVLELLLGIAFHLDNRTANLIIRLIGLTPHPDSRRNTVMNCGGGDADAGD